MSVSARAIASFFSATTASSIARSWVERSSDSVSASRFCNAPRSLSPRARTSAVKSSAFWISVTQRYWLPPAPPPDSTVPMSMPAAAALTSSAGSIGGSNRGSWRTTPARFMQWRILYSRSATVSQ